MTARKANQLLIDWENVSDWSGTYPWRHRETWRAYRRWGCALAMQWGRGRISWDGGVSAFTDLRLDY